MTRQIIPRQQPSIIAPPDLIATLIATLTANNRRTAKSVLLRFDAWLTETGRSWHTPDLAAYRDHLLGRNLQPTTINNQLAAIRGRYRDILANKRTGFIKDCCLRQNRRFCSMNWGQEAGKRNKPGRGGSGLLELDKDISCI